MLANQHTSSMLKNMSSRHSRKNHTNYRGYLMRAYRPVENAGEWLVDTMEHVAEVAGDRVRFFDADDLEELRLTLIGTGEFFKVQRQSHRLGEMCMKQVTRAARREAPQSFREPGNFAPARFMIRRAAEATHFSMVFTQQQLLDERAGLTTGVDLTASQWHAWHPDFVPTIKLGTVHGRVPEVAIEEMNATALPTDIATGVGIARPAPR